jgi:hypothetical protein
MHRKCIGGSFWGRASSSGEKQEIHQGRERMGGGGWVGGDGRPCTLGGSLQHCPQIQISNSQKLHSGNFRKFQDPDSSSWSDSGNFRKFRDPDSSSGGPILETSGSFRIQIPARGPILETSGSFRIQIPARVVRFWKLPEVSVNDN